MGIVWHWAVCDRGTKPTPGQTSQPRGPCLIHSETNESVVKSWNWPDIDEIASRIRKETGAGYCETIDDVCRLFSEAQELASRHPWVKLGGKNRDPWRLMPDGVRWQDPDGLSVRYASERSREPMSWLQGLTLLSAAAYWNLIPLAKRLLGAGLDPTADALRLPPAMMLAAWAGHAEMLRLFQEHFPQARRRHRGVNYLEMNWVGKADTTAIVGAAARGDIEMLELAISPAFSEDGGQGPVVTAPCGTSWRNQTFLGQALEVALEYTTDWQVYLYVAQFFNGASYLGDFFKGSQRVVFRHLQQHVARGNLEMARRLLDAATRATGSCGMLQRAARRRYAEAVDFLLAMGLDPNLQDERFQRALVPAVSKRDWRIVRALLAHGAVVTKCAVLGALRAESIPMVELLLVHYPGDYIHDLTGVRELMLKEGRKSMAYFLKEVGVPR